MKKQIFGTKEWAASNVNIQSGCPNDCRYCYAKSMAIRHKRKTRENWKVLEKGTDSLPLHDWLRR